MEKIRKMHRPCPHLTHQVCPICSFYENIAFLAFLIGIANQPDAGLNDGYVMVILQYVPELFEWEAFCVDGECLVIMHVIDIAPNGVQWKLIFPVFGYDCFQS